MQLNMELEKAATPLKLYSAIHMSGKMMQMLNNENVEMITTPGGSRCQKKMLHPRTPSKPRNCSMSTTISSISSTSSKQISYSTSSNTPPAKRFHRIRNPFEPVLAERLHLPLIASPSLFQRPTTPQLSSTQFEWNIDEVSSLQPANVEPHETQFHDSPDPEYEAKAQSAISSYFKEHQIVPSPVDCPLRSQRIILSELNSNTPITKPGRRIRDCGTQTELSLPVILPRALEEALMPYFQPHLCVPDPQNCDRDSQISLSRDTNGMSFHESKDMSLRRKLFDLNNIEVLEDGRTPTAESKLKISHTNSSPSSTCGSSRGMQFAIIGKLSDSLDKSSFGSLSPISASDCLSNSPHSPQNNRNTTKSNMHTFLQNLDDAEPLSPIERPVWQTTSRRCLDKTQQHSNNMQFKASKESYRCTALNQSEATTLGDLSLACANSIQNNSDNFTPDRSSSPLRTNNCSTDVAIGQHSIDSNFNMKVSRLVVNSAKCVKQQQQQMRSQDYDMLAHDDTQDLIDEDDMQVSQLSAQNFNYSSSSSSDTPRSKRRSASRKNLSQSFSLNWLDDEDLVEADKQQQQYQKQEGKIMQKSPLDVPRIDITVVDELIVKEHEMKQHQHQLQQQQLGEHSQVPKAIVHATCSIEEGKQADDAINSTRSLFYRTDSGFNEMPASGSSSTFSIGVSQQSEGALSPTKQSDVSMVLCSTPSKRTAIVTNSSS